MVMSRGPKSTRGSTGSWNWGRGSISGSESREESKGWRSAIGSMGSWNCGSNFPCASG